MEPLIENGFKFETDKHICNVNSPIIILHAEDDHVVPFKLGLKVNTYFTDYLALKYGCQLINAFYHNYILLFGSSYESETNVD